MSVSEALQAAEAQREAGSSLEALQTLAQALTDHPEATELYLAASRALIAAEDEKAVTGWDGFAGLARQLLRHTPSADPMLTLAHEAASNLTSGNRDAVTRLARVMKTPLEAALDPEREGTTGFKNALVFALTIRAVAGDWMDQARLSRLHLAHFDRFTAEDTALPYSVMFNPDIFGQNRDELLAEYWPGKDTKRLYALPPDRVLFFSWLAGRDAFDGPEALSDYFDRHLPGESADRKAARMLLLRHWTGPAPDKLAAWGLTDIAPLLAEITSAKLPAARRADRAGARKLQDRAYQALNAGKNRYAPFLASRGKPRVAICLSGQLRGYTAALETWKETILRSIEPVFFIHSWEGIGRSGAEPFRYVLPFEGKRFAEAYKKIGTAQGYATMQERYPSLFTALAAGNTVDADTLKEAYGTDHVVLEDDGEERFADFSNQQKMHYKIHAADQMAQDHGGFDLHMRLRPDLAMGLVGFDWRDLKAAADAAPVIFAEKPAGLHYHNLMIGDQCAVGRPEVMALYAGTWERFPKLAEARLARCPDTFTGHVSLALTAWTQGVAVDRLPIRFGTLQDASPLPAREILSALEADSRDDADDQTLITAIRADIGSV